jgi:SAM-dependent methyltransferase
MERFVQAYASGEPEDLPWYHPEPDADLVRWFGELLDRPSRVIDLGAGPSVHGILLAGAGHHVTAVDGVEAARDLGLRLAGERGVELDYRVADVLEWEPPEGAAWDLVLDRGFLHALGPADRPRWLAQVRTLLRPGGWVVAKEFTAVPRGFGPPGLTAADMLAAIREGQPDGLRLVELALSSFNLSDEPGLAGSHSAWTLVARR